MYYSIVYKNLLTPASFNCDLKRVYFLGRSKNNKGQGIDGGNANKKEILYVLNWSDSIKIEGI